MSVKNKKVIDIVIVYANGNAILTIADRSEWDAENEHFTISQEKINPYLGAIENRELYKKCPHAKDISITQQYIL